MVATWQSWQSLSTRSSTNANTSNVTNHHCMWVVCTANTGTWHQPFIIFYYENDDHNETVISSYTQLYWCQAPVCHETEQTWNRTVSEHKYMLYTIINDGIRMYMYQHICMWCTSTHTHHVSLWQRHESIDALWGIYIYHMPPFLYFAHIHTICPFVLICINVPCWKAQNAA